MPNIEDEEWIKLGRSIKQRKAQCYFCGFKSKGWQERLVIHHINCIPMDNTKDNLVILCLGCHKRLHIKIYSKLGIKTDTSKKRRIPYISPYQ